MILLAFAAATVAQPATAPAHPANHAAPAAAAATTSARFSVASSKIADLLANPAAKAAIEAVLPGFSAHPQIGMAGQFTLKSIQAMTQGQITDAHLEQIEKALAAIPAA
jgi:hypothetical protein